MKMLEEMNETELQEQLRKLEMDREDVARNQEKAAQERENDDFQTGRRYYDQDHLRIKFSQHGGRLLNLVDAAQDIRQSVKKRRIEVDAQFQNLLHKKQQEWNRQEEDIYHKLQELQESEEED